MDQETWDAVLDRLKESLQALALPADTQLILFPDFVCKADELALDYDHWFRCALSNSDSRLTAEQESHLRAVDSLLDQMTGQADSSLWSDEAVHVRPEWEVARRAAREALAVCGWKVEVPPHSKTI